MRICCEIDLIEKQQNQMQLIEKHCRTFLIPKPAGEEELLSDG